MIQLRRDIYILNKIGSEIRWYTHMKSLQCSRISLHGSVSSLRVGRQLSLNSGARGDFYRTDTSQNTVKFRKYFPGLIFFKGPFGGAYNRRGLSTEGNLHFKIDWASLIVGSEFTVFALFYFVFEGNFPSTCPRGAYIWRGDLTEGFLRYRFGGLIFKGTYTWKSTV